MSLDKQSLHEVYKHSQEENNKKIKMLLDIVKQYSPLAILKRCYEEIMHYCLISENQGCTNSDLEALQNVLPYLQSIIYSVQLNDNPKETIEENIFQSLIETAKAIYMSTNILQMFDENEDTNNTIDELQLKARLEWLNIKGKRQLYSHHKVYILRFLFLLLSFKPPYAEILSHFPAFQVPVILSSLSVCVIVPEFQPPFLECALYPDTLICVK